jgi:hypothetical protein
LPTSALTVGSHAIIATYNGDSSFNASSSNPANVSVNKAGTSTALFASAGSALLGQPVTFAATVTATSAGAGTPTGLVTFMDGGTAVGIGALNSLGVATFTTASLSPGLHSISAVYGGDANVLGSISPGVGETITQPPPPTRQIEQAQPPALNKPSLLSLFDQLLGGVEVINANGTETVVDNFFGIPLVSTYDASGNLVSVTMFGLNVTSLFSL